MVLCHELSHLTSFQQPKLKKIKYILLYKPSVKRYNEISQPQLYHSAIRLEKPEESLYWLRITQN